MKKMHPLLPAGFTLIELILYISILSFIMSALIPFAWNVITSGTKNTTQQLVFSQARFVSEKIRYEIRNASGINSVTTNSISLATTTPSTNPTVIDLNSGQIRITQGSGSPVNLLSNNLTATSLVFSNYSSGDNKTKNIQFTLTLTANFSVSGQEYNETTSIRSAAEVRTN